MSDTKNEQTDTGPSLLAALAAMEERLQAGQAVMETRQQERQDAVCRAVQDVQLQLSTWKEELKQFTRESCHGIMQELEGEMTRLTETVEQRMGHLEARLQAAEQSALSHGAPFAATCPKREKPSGEDDHASNGGGQHGWDAEGVFSVRGGTSAPGSCGTPNHPSTPPPLACRRKPQEYDGRVPWDAYHAQFEILAEAQAWDSRGRAVQLVSSLKGVAVEVLSQLTLLQRTSYDCVGSSGAEVWPQTPG